jgi:PKD repeat protein
MASPHVAAVGALLMSEGATADEARTILQTTAVDLGDPGYDAVYGYGFLDAAAAVAALNEPPVAVAGGPYSGLVGEDITFDASGSSDTDGNIVSWEWDFVDGTPTQSGAVVTHSYPSPGNYILVVEVTDDDGATDWSTATVDVDAVPNLPPTAVDDGPWEGTASVEMTFDGSASFDPDGTIVSWEWTFGDGATGSGSTVTHTYAAPGSYWVTLTVTDDLGGKDFVFDQAVVLAP